MAYGSELILNGTAEAMLAGWTSDSVYVYGVSGSRYFLLGASAYMTQSFDTVQFSVGQEEKHYLIEALFKYDIPQSLLAATVLAQMTLTINYGDSTLDIFTIPLSIADHDEVSHNSTIWYQVSEELIVKANAVVTSAIINIDVFSTTTCNLMIDSVSVKRSITDAEAHENSLNPHNLPLTISVGNFGIKAVKDAETMFWLKDDGSAYFAGTIDGADGVFAGTVFAENIDTTNAKITIAQIEQLIVGDNVSMGPGAVIGWNNITDIPSLLDLDEFYTLIGEDFIVTGDIYANQITAGQFAAARIDTSGLFAERLYDPDHSGNYLELGDASPTSSFMDMRLVHYLNGEIFKVRDNVTGAAIYLYGNEILNYNEGVNRTVAYDNWSFVGGVVDFTGATAVLGIDGGGEGGSTSFLGLTDTPTEYAGNAGHVVKVNDDSTALEFAKDRYEKYLYTKNAAENIITTSVTSYILNADLDEDSHIMVHCMLKGVSSAAQQVIIEVFAAAQSHFSASYQLETGTNTIIFAYPLWSVEEALGIPIKIEVKTSIGTFTIAISDLMYWINSVGIIGGIAAEYPTIDVADTITVINVSALLDTVTAVESTSTQTPVVINLSDTIAAINIGSILGTVTETSLDLDVQTP